MVFELKLSKLCLSTLKNSADLKKVVRWVVYNKARNNDQPEGFICLIEHQITEFSVITIALTTEEDTENLISFHRITKP